MSNQSSLIFLLLQRFNSNECMHEIDLSLSLIYVDALWLRESCGIVGAMVGGVAGETTLLFLFFSPFATCFLNTRIY